MPAMEAAGWLCRACASSASLTYSYPPTPDAYCSTCAGPLDVQERIAAALAVLARGAAAPASNSERPLLTSAEAARLLGTTPKGLEALRRRGKLPPSVGPGRRLLFRREDLLTCASRVPSPRRSRR
jgi:Helix-turn-helix domain